MEAEIPEGMEGLIAIHQMQVEGAIWAELEGDRHYMLTLHQVYPNGTSSEIIEDPEIAKVVGELLGLGPPTDPGGWGVWEVDEVVERKAQ